ncbi:M15 family metallopeptidase [Paenibacillus selenitireducens]|nr:M15 family metallopeptidase [Paenibacillus selenitireducens]
MFLVLLLFAAWRLIDGLGLIPDFQRNSLPIVGLHPTVEKKSKELVELAAKKGIRVVITTDFRSIEEQNRLYRQGRDSKGKVVTNAEGGESYHNYGLAIDFALQDKAGNVLWDMERDNNKNGKTDWLEVAELAKGLGFSWGGDWKQFPDFPHLQMDFGYTISRLKSGHYPKGSLTEKQSQDA